MRYETRTTPEGHEYNHAIASGPQDLPRLTPQQKERFLADYGRLYEEGRVVRGVYQGRNAAGEAVYCAMGVMGLVSGILTGVKGTVLVHANNSAPGTCAIEGKGHPGHGEPILPSAYAEVCQIIKECPEPKPVESTDPFVVGRRGRRMTGVTIVD